MSTMLENMRVIKILSNWLRWRDIVYIIINDTKEFNVIFRGFRISLRVITNNEVKKLDFQT